MVLLVQFAVFLAMMLRPALMLAKLMMKSHCRPSSYLAVCMGIAVIAGGGSCHRVEHEVIPPAASVSRQTLDEQVIEAALVDLATSPDKESRALLQEQGGGTLMFSGKSRDWVGTLRQALAKAESQKWKSFAASHRDAAKSGAAMVIDRVESKQPFAAFVPKDSHIRLWEADPASTQPVNDFAYAGPRPLVAAPPGYGDQRRLAVVVFNFPWSMHDGDATYVLRFDGNGWHVISRQFVYYV